MEGKSVGWKTTALISIIVFGLCLAYAIVRYNIVRGVSFDNLPLFIANKAIALSATILIGLSFLFGPLTHVWKGLIPHLYLRKHIGVVGFGVAALHTLMSLTLLDKAYYPRFYTEGGKFNLIGESVLLLGILAFLIFGVIVITSLPPIEKHMHPGQWKLVQRLGYLAYFFVLLHVTVMGFTGWFRPESWQYGLVSISLIAALFIIFVLLVRISVIGFKK